MTKEKLYIVSGLGADFSVLEKIRFPAHLEVVFLPWLIPTKGEKFSHYVHRMAEKIDSGNTFHLLGYSFGGVLVQEIAKYKKPDKLVILGSIRRSREKSTLMNVAQFFKVTHILPTCFFNPNSAGVYFFFRKVLDPKNPHLLRYFAVKNPYYIQWCIQKMVDWKPENLPESIQILGERDIVFPVRKCTPEYIIRGATHLFPITKHREVSRILEDIFS